MPNRRTGQDVTCPYCGTIYYRSGHEIQRGKKRTCGDAECKSADRSGQNNPFWGQTHSQETRKRIRQGRAKNPPKGTGPPKGYKHTELAKQRIAESSRRLWHEHREKMLASLPRGTECRFYKEPETRRHRKDFTRRQRREWIGTECAYCGSTEDLVLDHIIPIFDGGTNHKANAQTLCQPCNLWKVYHVDLPRRKAAQATKGADFNPE